MILRIFRKIDKICVISLYLCYLIHIQIDQMLYSTVSNEKSVRQLRIKIIVICLTIAYCLFGIIGGSVLIDAGFTMNRHYTLNSQFPINAQIYNFTCNETNNATHFNDNININNMINNTLYSCDLYLIYFVVESNTPCHTKIRKNLNVPPIIRYNRTVYYFKSRPCEATIDNHILSNGVFQIILGFGIIMCTIIAALLYCHSINNKFIT